MKRVAEMHVCAACALRAQLRGSSTAFALAGVRYLDASLRGCDAIGAARLGSHQVGGWLGLDGGLVEQDRLRRKGPGGGEGSGSVAWVGRGSLCGALIGLGRVRFPTTSVASELCGRVGSGSGVGARRRA